MASAVGTNSSSKTFQLLEHFSLQNLGHLFLRSFLPPWIISKHTFTSSLLIYPFLPFSLLLFLTIKRIFSHEFAISLSFSFPTKWPRSAILTSPRFDERFDAAGHFCSPPTFFVIYFWKKRRRLCCCFFAKKLVCGSRESNRVTSRHQKGKYVERKTCKLWCRQNSRGIYIRGKTQ